MIVTTTQTVETKKVLEYKGIVTGEAILGANVFRDLFAGLRNIIGGRSGAYEDALREAKGIAIEEMTQAAQQLGASAILGVDLDYENITFGDGGSMLMVTASGTAVVLA